VVKPERRTKGDLMAATAIVVVIAVAAALIWWTSDARATISRPAATPVPAVTTAKDVPVTLKQLWTAPSPKTTEPIIAAGSVVTGDGHQVDGRDPATGAVLWIYARDLDLCGVTSIYQYAVAVYPDVRGCGQVSTIDGKTGRRGPTRTSQADQEVTLSSDDSTVLSAGDSRLEQWRSDMARTISYGALDARFKREVPAQPLCRLASAAASSSAVSVLESCPQQPDMRLTLLRPAKEEDQPDTKHIPLPGVADVSDAQVVAVNGTTTAVYLPTPQPVVTVYDETGTVIASTLMSKPASPQATVSVAGDYVTWWTGDSVMVFDANALRYKYTVSPVAGNVPVGPATFMAGKLLVPVTGGYDVFEPATGKGVSHVNLARTPIPTAVIPAVAGSQVLEQRGGTLVALGS
jgi:hypothetical protein